jgi:ABC-type phosphate/phosphonate transport system permease subunit
MKDFKQKIQNLPEKKRKMILWTVMILIGLALAIFYVKDLSKRFQDINLENFKEDIQVQFLEKELKDIPVINQNNDTE